MFNKLKKRMKEDKGDAVIVLGLMLIMSLILVGGILLDISKAYQLKSSYIDSARKATQAAIMEQTTEGYLRPEAAGEAVRVYEGITRPSVVNVNGYFSKCADYGDDDVILEVVFMNEKGGQMDMGSISRSDVAGVDDAEAITNMMTTLNSGKRTSIRNGKYTSVKLEVTEGTENAILPGAFSITQAESERANGMRCQKMNITAKANIFVGHEDGLYN